ncbi:MAG: PA14 domain-containing protein [Armatimonadetes bacterium]|nr:PA14 domain-containing protein [Armatimonadota bacterium]
MNSKKSFVRLVLLVTAVAVLGPMAEAANTNYTSNRSPLVSTPYVPLPMGTIRAKGWLLKQLELQKTGLTGNAESVYGELGANSGWLGGNAADSSWERPTYYLRGLIPLAYTLNDATLKTRAQKWIDWAINSQQASGYFGTSDGDWWARMPMLIMMEDYYDATQDARVLTFLQKYFAYQAANVPSGGLGYWGAARVADNILAVQWLYNRNGDPTLLTFMDTLKGLAEDWTTALTNGTFGDNHGVNVAEGFKLPAVWYQKSLSATDRDAFMAGHNNGMRMHGQAHYMLSCTEFMAGKSSLQGPELCAIVDRIFSDGVTMTIVGNPKIGDITERLAFNALPGCLSKTMRQQQYYTLPNQAQSLYGAKGIFGQDYVDALTPSWVSGWPCCCFNWHMGWPRFVQFSWAATSDNGLAIFTYAPTEVTALVGSGVSVKFVEDTNYPFEEQIRLTLTTAQSVQFPLEVRIPEWCASPSVKVNGVAQYSVFPGIFYRINRTWSNNDTVTLDFPMTLKTTTQFNNSVAVERGPLVYSLKVGENWVKRETKTVNGLDFGEYEVKPTTDWNYGLIIDRKNPAASLTVNQGTMPANPFVQSDTPITITARAKKVPSWTMAVNGLPNEVPVGPVSSDALEETVTLVPFGAENLRITYFPEVVESGFAGGLTGQYYSDKNMTNLVMTRVDPAVNFDWGASPPAAGMNKDSFAIRWSGQIKPRYTGAYTFYVTSDDGRRLWVNNQQIINNWVDGSGTSTSTTISLTAGTWYSIKLEYYENNSAASVAMEWSSSSQAREIAPPSCLRSADSVDSDLIYTFDENAGTIAKDSSGSDRHGALMNGTMWTTGKIGSAISLDGLDDYVAVPNIGNRASFTLMAWVKVDMLANARNALFHCDGWESGDAALSVANTGELIFALNGASAEEQSSAYKFCGDDLGRWKHVTLVYDSAAKSVKFYLDGVLDSTRSYTAAPVAALNGIRIGGWDGGGRSFDGKIDDFRIYSRILTAAEITAMGDTGESRGLRAQYFDNIDFTAQKLVRSDANIDFNWGTGSPNASIGVDTFSVRWTGKIRPKYSETYTFYTTSDDGVRLWINGQLIIDNWTNHTATVDSGTISLVAGRKYDIKLDYYDNLTTAQIKLEWASASQIRETVPASHLLAPENYVDPSLAWYKFDEASGTAVIDSTGNGNNALVNGSYSRLTGKFGKAINLNPSTGYVSMPAGIMQNCTDFSISAWVKIDTNSTWARIFDIGSGTSSYMFLCLMQGSGIRYAIKYSSGGEQICDCPIALPTGIWKHLAVTQVGSVVTIYMDGSQVAQNKGITNKPSGLGATTQSWIGRSQYNDPYLDGMVDDFRIYTWGLSATEIAAMVADRPDNCIGYIKKTGIIGNQVMLVGKVVTWADPVSFYIQCPEIGHTTCGIKVISSALQTPGAVVNVSGVLGKNTDDELVVNATLANPGLAKDMPKAMGRMNRNVCGGTQGVAQGATYGVGINTVGTLQTTWGKATNVVVGSSMTIYDGSTFIVKTPILQGIPTPITVYGPIYGISDGDYVRVTGVSTIRKTSGVYYRTLVTRSWDDVVLMSHAIP